MYCPDIFKDDERINKKIITYLSVHGFEFLHVGMFTRIICPDKFTTFHYCAESQMLRYLTNEKGEPVYNVVPFKVDGFLGALCSHILPKHKPSIIYNVCKIPYLNYEAAVKQRSI